MKQDILLWTPILVPPAVWFINLLAKFALAGPACFLDWKFSLYIISAVAAIITLAACGLAWSLWRKASNLGAEGAPASRVRALAAAGLILSISFLLVIIAQAIPEIAMPGCA